MVLPSIVRVLVSKLVFFCGSDIRKIFLFHIKRICAYCNDPINGGGFEIPTQAMYQMPCLGYMMIAILNNAKGRVGVNQLKRLVVSGLLFASFGANAECWIIGDLKGQEASSSDGYNYKLSSIPDTFHLVISKEKADLILAKDGIGGGIDYYPLSPNAMRGRSYRDGQLTLVTWAISNDGKVIHTRTISRSDIGSFTGSFVGNVKGKC